MELADPVLFSATLDKITAKRNKGGLPPEYAIALTAIIDPSDLVHLAALQQSHPQRGPFISVAFTPAPAP